MKKLIDFKNIHCNDKIIVCGLGDSLVNSNYNSWKDKVITIGNNDIVQYFTPKYHLTCDTIDFSCDQRYIDKHLRILDSQAAYIFAHSPQQFKYQDKMILYDYEGFSCIDALNNIERRNVLFTCQTSITISLSLSMFMGSRMIGILGFDLYGHPLYKNRQYINDHMQIVNDYAIQKKIQIYNLSDNSCITAFEYMELNKYLRKRKY